MTTNDPTYYARRHRLNTADEDATVTIPDGWTPPGEPLDLVVPRLRRELEPGDVLTNDGSGDSSPWLHDTMGYTYSSDLALLGLDVDPAPAEDEDDQDDSTGDTPPATTGCDCEYCEAVRNGDEDDRSRGTTFGTVSVNVVPDTSDLELTGDEPPRLDEYQRERVAALDEALRILEARRAPETANKARSFGDVFAPTGRPMVKHTDLVTVAAFIADGTLPGGDKA